MQLIKRAICNILGTALGVELKLSGLVDVDVELAKRHYLHITTATTTTAITSKAKGIKATKFRECWGNFDLNQNTLCA